MNALRPTTLDTYLGQPALSARLRVLIAAARARKEITLPHVLLQGPGGLGKTTVAHVIANEMGGRAHVAMGPALETAADAFGLLQRIQAGDVLFVDEIHRLKSYVAEILYTVLEDGKVYFPYNGAQVEIQLPPFTFIGATTMPELLDDPLRQRFVNLALSFYAPDALAAILAKNAVAMGVAADPAALRLLASRARGTPRVANHLLRFARDLACIESTPITTELAERSLSMQGIDEIGLNDVDRGYLRCVIEVYGGGPVGAQAIAATLGVKPDQVAAVIEPFLLQQALVIRTQRGRKATEKAVKHLAQYDAATAPTELFAA